MAYDHFVIDEMAMKISCTVSVALGWFDSFLFKYTGMRKLLHLVGQMGEDIHFQLLNQRYLSLVSVAWQHLYWHL